MRLVNRYLVAGITAGMVLSNAVMVAVAQYTPGSGPYIPPSTPTVPAPSNAWDTPQPQPSYQQPTYQQPTYQQPSYQQPTYQQPSYQQPAYGYDQAQNAQPQYAQPQIVPAQPPVMVPQLAEQQLAELTASIALYPDPLLGQLLPAATYVEELTYADRWQEQHPGADEATIASLPLEPSVKAIMHYPAVLDIMVGHLDWTQSLGMAFTYQRDGIMNSIQSWRITALTYGTLRSSPEQQVLSQGNFVMIMPPPRQAVCYVPVYDPQVVYVRPVRPVGTVITFRAGPVSLRYLDNDVDWHDHEVRVPVRHDWDRYDNHFDDHRDDRRDPRDNDRNPPPRGGTTVIMTPPKDNPRSSTVVVPAPAPRPAQAAPKPQATAQTGEIKTVFVRDTLKPNMVYPQRIVTPADNKVVTLPAAPPPAAPAATPAPPATQPGRGNRGQGQGRGNGPNTSY